MQKAPIPKFEKERICAVEGLKILDTPAEERFDKITKEATEKLHVPISTIAIIDSDREWYKSYQGLTVHEGDRDISFCGHAMLAGELFVIEDTLLDKRFADNPMVVCEKPIRFYAGMALYEYKTKMPVGVFCVKDYKPRRLNTAETGVFMDLAKKAEEALN